MLEIEEPNLVAPSLKSSLKDSGIPLSYSVVHCSSNPVVLQVLLRVVPGQATPVPQNLVKGASARGGVP